MGLVSRTTSPVVIAALALVCTPTPRAHGSAAREYLDHARAAARTIQLSGDQSAALRSVACALADHDPQSALDITATTRRPSDAARALAAVARNLANTDPALARQAATTGARLLLRISGPDHRLAEQRLLLREVAALEEEALLAAFEVPVEEGRLAVVLGRAESDPAAALELVQSWEMTGLSADRALTALAPISAAADSQQAVELAATISSGRLRDQALWLIAERASPAEAVGIAQRTSDWLVKSAILADAAERMAASETEAALLCVEEVSAARDSALAQVVVGLAAADRAQALELGASLPELPRRWALGRIAVALAGSEPEAAEALLAEIGPPPEIARLAVVSMADADPDRAIRLAGRLPAGESRDAALAGVVAVLSKSDVERAAGLVWEIASPRWRGTAVGAVAPILAQNDPDAATSLIGLVSDPEVARRLRAEVAAVVAADDPETAFRLLSSLPPSEYRSEAAMDGARALLSARGSTEDALRLATIGLEHDLALRWLVPSLARSRVRSPIAMAQEIESPYLRALSLVDAAREVLGSESKPLLTPERARQVRPIVEWEGG